MVEVTSRRRFLRDGLMFGAGVATTVGGLVGLAVHNENKYRAEWEAERSEDYKDSITGQIDNGLKLIEHLEYEHPNTHQLVYLKAQYVAFKQKYDNFIESEQKDIKGMALVEHVSKLSDFNQEILGLQINLLRLREILQEEKEKNSLREKL